MFRAVSLATLLATLLSGSSFAQSPVAPEGKRVAVNYSDLDLSRPAGAQVLLTRLRAAAAQACGPAPDIRDLVMDHFYRACLRGTVERAVASVNAPVVTELYRGTPTILASGAE